MIASTSHELEPLAVHPELVELFTERPTTPTGSAQPTEPDPDDRVRYAHD